MRTVKGVTYFGGYTTARQYALDAGLPTDRIIAYGLGWAIQREKSGPYWNAEIQGWQ